VQTNETRTVAATLHDLVQARAAKYTFSAVANANVMNFSRVNGGRKVWRGKHPWIDKTASNQTLIRRSLKFVVSVANAVFLGFGESSLLDRVGIVAENAAVWRVSPLSPCKQLWQQRPVSPP
jgi:hypothetical protein